MSQGKAYTDEQRVMILESLKDYLEIGFSRSKACKMVGFDETTLSKWLSADEALSMKVQGWENAMNKLALANIRDAMMKESEMDDNRKDTSKWWSERRMKDDFSTRQEATGADGKDLPAPIISLDVLRNNSTPTDSSS
jgi:hypothetical protein